MICCIDININIFAACKEKQGQCEKSFKQLKFLQKETLFLCTLPVCAVCPVQIAHRVLKNFISKMAIIYTTEADVEA